MNLKLLRPNNGMTLIELIISLVILSSILIAAFAFFSFSNRIFNKGVDQYSVQSNIRLASDYIISQIRYATEVKILDSIDPEIILDPFNNINAYENYLYYYEGKIIRLSRYSANHFYVGVGGGIEFSNTSTDKILNFIVRGIDSKQKYSLESEVKPLNLEIGGNDINASRGTVIFYRTVNDYLGQTALPEATLGNSEDPQKVNVHFNKKIENSEITSDNVSEPASTIKIIDNSNLEITINAPGASIGRKIVMVVELDDFGLYEYALTYTTGWSIE
jgi:prepilin-type N-terminal cleavage/methylation domain-containing protein